MRNSSRAALLAMMATAGLMASVPLTAVQQTKPAILRAQSMPRIFPGGSLGGLVPRHRWFAEQHRYRKKPWTCTAIEKRKAAKRRNVMRHRARRHA